MSATRAFSPGSCLESTNGLRAGRVVDTNHGRRVDDPVLMAGDLSTERNAFDVIVIQSGCDSIECRVHAIESGSGVVFQTLKTSFESIESRIMRVEPLVDLVELTLQLCLHVREHRRQCCNVLLCHICRSL
jgi:hypothetical protein